MLTQALDYFQTHQPEFLEQLIELVKIPSVSFEGFDPSQVQKSAEYTAQLLSQAGLENVEILKIPGTHPYVYADWLHAPNQPTLLLYAHHDVQPPMDESRWVSPPFEPQIRKGRLYGRGSADDKAGVLIHVASIASFLKSAGKLPVNVKVIIEGEEEIGSHHLPQFLKKYQKKLAADAMVLTDLANFDTGLPSLTTSLRGLVAIELTVKTSDHPLHSGLWSGPLPDPNMAMAKILSSLTKPNGEIDIPGINTGVLKLRKDELRDFAALPLNEKIFLQNLF
jgi:acetylornithine deacetylase/succinyl-diaminopimelate desuccinylase-like protein